jgi:hypothetical protein
VGRYSVYNGYLRTCVDTRNQPLGPRIRDIHSSVSYWHGDNHHQPSYDHSQLS